MKRTFVFVTLAVVLAAASAQAAKPSDKETATQDTPAAAQSEHFQTEAVSTRGTVSVGGGRIDYDAICGTLVVHPEGWDDVAKASTKDDDDAAANPDAEASMFYVAYFKRGADATRRPVTFLFNGGPGSATVWLHMGAFGPQRVITANDSHTPAAPYQIVNNDYSLLDASDLVFIDAPGTGFSRVAGKDKEKAFFGVDPDAHAFAEFITGFLARYGRWNSPKFIFGESYGTPRAAVLVNLLGTQYAVDINGVIMLSQILNFSLSVDDAEVNPGVDLPYVVALPTYAASAWYHKKLPGNAPADLTSFLAEVEAFAVNEYNNALVQGSMLPEAERKAIAEKLHGYTGLPVAYILKANLRINGGMFEKTLQDDANLTTGRLDTRFSGPTMDPLSKSSQYDPQSAAISSAYVTAFNEYARKTLKYGGEQTFFPFRGLWQTWDYGHHQPGVSGPVLGCNTLPDLAMAMKRNPGLKILLTGGYYDVATPYFEGKYEMRHLTIPDDLRDNIEYRYYESGHMIYAHEASMKALHDDVAAFITRNDNVGK